jgi:dTDP-4-dehydrorhamnose reductase
MKILLIGKNGQVGWELQRSLSTLGELVAVDFFDTELCGDLTKPEGIAQTIRAVQPDVVVNAARIPQLIRLKVKKSWLSSLMRQVLKSSLKKQRRWARC